jgi:methionyl-tRNA formyltransferase
LHQVEEVMRIILDDAKVSQGFIDLSEAEYWPRLSTDIHGWIDWQWTSLEIIRFIHAFGDPFEGAKTELLGRVIHFKEAFLIEQRIFHPFSQGIITRHNADESIDVVVADGIIRLIPIFPQTIGLKSLKGLRLHTPFDKLEKAKKSNLNSKDM